MNDDRRMAKIQRVCGNATSGFCDDLDRLSPGMGI